MLLALFRWRILRRLMEVMRHMNPKTLSENKAAHTTAGNALVRIRASIPPWMRSNVGQKTKTHMNHKRGKVEYSSVYVDDKKDWFCGFELYCALEGKTQRIASVIYWDACGQFFVETFGSDVPLDILEELISETRERVKTE